MTHCRKAMAAVEVRNAVKKWGVGVGMESKIKKIPPARSGAGKLAPIRRQIDATKKRAESAASDWRHSGVNLAAWSPNNSSGVKLTPAAVDFVGTYFDMDDGFANQPFPAPTSREFWQHKEQGSELTAVVFCLFFWGESNNGTNLLPTRRKSNCSSELVLRGGLPTKKPLDTKLSLRTL